MGGVSRYVQTRSHNTQLYLAQLRIMPFTFGASNKTESQNLQSFNIFCKCWVQLITDYVYSVMQKLLDTRGNMLNFKCQVTSLLLCMYWCTCALTHTHNSRVSELENLAVQYFNLSQSPMLMPVFLLFKTGSNEFWWGHIAGESASPTRLQLHWSLSAYSGFVFNYLRLVVSVLCGMRPFFNL
jgi:hypothetical protein